MGLLQLLKRMFGGSGTPPVPPVPNRVDPVFGELTGGDGEWIASMPLNPGGAKVEVLIQTEGEGDRLDRAFEVAREQFTMILASKAQLRSEIIGWIREYYEGEEDVFDFDLSTLKLPVFDESFNPDSPKLTVDPIELETCCIDVRRKPSVELSFTGIVYNHWCHFQIEDGRIVSHAVDG